MRTLGITRRSGLSAANDAVRTQRRQLHAPLTRLAVEVVAQRAIGLHRVVLRPVEDLDAVGRDVWLDAVDGFIHYTQAESQR